VNNNLLVIAKQRVVLDCIFLYIHILLFIENKGDVSPENVIVCQSVGPVGQILLSQFLWDLQLV